MSVRTVLVAAIGAVGLASLAGCTAPSSPQVTQTRRDILLAIEGQMIDGKVPPNATLETLLRRHELPADTTLSLLNAVRSVFNPKQLRAHQEYRITRTLDGLLREFRYQIDADRLLRVIVNPGRPGVIGVSPASGSVPTAPVYSAEVITIPKTFELNALSFEIGRGQSLIGVLEASGENIQLALEMASIFGGEVDFNSDLQPGDRCEVLFERATRYGEFVGYGEVKAAVLENAGRRLTAVRTVDAEGKPVWYDAEGRSLKRQFLKSPLPFDPRITSRFSTRRLHPVHKFYRAHLGVDYGAPSGTAVKTVATGVVEFAGWSGEAGRMVRVRHAGGYETSYLHLSSVAPGIRPGVRVTQGDLIGRVGSTGSATGPHLDYRISKNGRFVDPVAEHKRMPKGDPLSASELPAFLLLKDDVMGQLSALLAARPQARPDRSAAPR